MYMSYQFGSFRLIVVEWMPLCTARVLAWQKLFPHRAHLNGFSLEWVNLQNKFTVYIIKILFHQTYFRINPGF